MIHPERPAPAFITYGIRTVRPEMTFKLNPIPERKITLFGKELPPHVGGVVHQLMKQPCETTLDGDHIVVRRVSDGFKLHLRRSDMTVVRADLSEVKTARPPGPAPEAPEEEVAAPRIEAYSLLDLERLFKGDITWDEYHVWGRNGDGDDPEPEDIDATPAAKDLADAHGIDLRTIAGSGKEGRVVTADVRKLIEPDTGNPGTK